MDRIKQDAIETFPSPCGTGTFTRPKYVTCPHRQCAFTGNNPGQEFCFACGCRMEEPYAETTPRGYMRAMKVLENAVSKRPTHTTTLEASCRQCERMNDVGSAKCWWCQCDNPTKKNI